VRLAQARNEDASQVLHHEAAGACAGIDGGEDEQRFEEDGEVIPERHHRLAVEDFGNDHRHADGKGRGTAGTRQNAFLADVLGHLGEHFRRHHEAPSR